MKNYKVLIVTANYYPEISEELKKHAKRVLGEKDIDVIIMGHDHIPRVETFSEGTYINLGTFFYHKTVALYNNGEYQLVRWRASDKEFVPFTESSAQK